MNKTMFNVLEKFAKFVLGFGVATFCAANCFAADPADIQHLVSNVQGSILVPILQAAVSTSYIGGIVFAIIGIFKFKAHKENPTQVPISTGVVMLIVGICLLFFPAIIKMAMNSLGFGSGTTDAGSLNWTGNTVTGGGSN